MDRFLVVFNKIIDIIIVLLQAAMLSITALQVLLRYVFNSPTIWSEELTLFFLVWFGFIVMAMGIRDDSHIAIEYFYDRRSNKSQKILDVIRFFSVISLAILILYFSIQLIKLGWNNKMPATQIRRSYLYASLLLGGILFLFFSFLNILNILKNNESKVQFDEL